jgi:hypothetical protein
MRPTWLQEYRDRQGPKWGVLVERHGEAIHSVNWLSDHDGPVEFDNFYEAEAKANELSRRVTQRSRFRFWFRAEYSFKAALLRK